MTLVSTHDVPSQCPYCGRVHQAATSEGVAPVRDGDASLCIGCGDIGMFDSRAPGGIRRTTAQEAARLATDPQCARFMLAWRMMDQDLRAQEIYSKDT